VGGLLAPLQDEFPGVRWLPPDSLHLTVLFIGDTDPARIPDVGAAMEAVAAGQPPFEIRTARGGGRTGPRHRGGIGVAWLNLDRGDREAAAMATDLGGRLGTGIAWPEMGHAPHLTIARRAPQALIARLRDADALPAVSWRQKRLVLFSSRLGGTGPDYEPRHEVLLGS
jgi:2'-5' RNA ligase